MSMRSVVSAPRAKSQYSTTHQSREEIKGLISGLREACRRPLFEEIVERQSKRVRQSDPPSNPRRSWDKLLEEAATLLPFMTIQEHGTVSRVAAIIFLGFLVPNSTGNEFFVPTEASHNSESHQSTSPLDRFIDMPLEERLENFTWLYAAGEFGEMDCCMDTLRERSFRSLLTSIGALLAGRPAHPTKTDILHLLAMAICPQSHENMIGTKIERTVPPRTKRLMTCIHAHSFHVNYSHRLALVKMVAEELVMPEVEGRPPSSEQDGAVLHLRAALHTFAIGAQSKIDSHWARCALVNIAVRYDETTVKEEWDALINLVMSDYGECHCKEPRAVTPESFCVHSARGRLLDKFLCQYNESRHYADAAFTGQALCRFNTFIQNQVAVMIDQSPRNIPNCLLVSLLAAARSLFYFILGENTSEQDEPARDRSQSKEGHACEMLLHSSIQLLHHPNVHVAKAASSLLALAFAYNPKEISVMHCQAVKKSIQMALDPCFENDDMDDTPHFRSMENVIIGLSRLSPAFAADMLEYLLGKLQNKSVLDKQYNARSAACFRLLAATLTARPFAALKHRESIVSLVKTTKDADCKSHLVVAILAFRQAHFFAKDCGKDTRVAIDQLISSISDPWIKYKVARHAMVTGNFSVAKGLFQSIISSTSSERSFLWMSTLAKVAGAEEELSSKGCRGILCTTPLLHSGVSYLMSLAAMSVKTTATSHSFGFQIECLQLRIDFLDMCASLRNLCREIRLSGTVPKRTVRTGLHLRNTLKLFYSLAARYRSLYRRYGLFLCQQSRTALRTCHAVCRWLGDAGRKAFPEALSTKLEKDDSTIWPRGDQFHPLILLLRRLNAVVIDPLDCSLEPQLRSAAMAEVLDAVLMAPFPIPRGFTTVKTVPYSSIRLSVDASTVENDGSKSTEDTTNDAQDEEDVVDVYPGMTCTIVVSGELDPSVIRMADVSFSRVLLWYALHYIAPLEDEEGRAAVHSSPSSLRMGGTPPSASPLLPRGKFLVPIQCEAPSEEGIYAVEVILGVRDIRCSEWEMPADGHSRPIMLRVSRSRA
jgi:hypothetical protein